jgi:hypothetical protein
MDTRPWHYGLTEKLRTRALVQGRLGCTCPEEVFHHYQVRQQTDTSLPVVELIMGDRLLVWIIDGTGISDPEQTLGQLLQAGYRDREKRGLNRFRLVVIGNFTAWEKQFGHLADALDHKVHLHVVPEIDPP